MVSTTAPKTTQKVIYEFIRKNERNHLIKEGEEGFTITEIAEQFNAKYTAVSRTLSRMTKKNSKYPLEGYKDGTIVRYSATLSHDSETIDADTFWKTQLIPYLRADMHPLLKSIRDTHGGEMKSGGGYQNIMKKTIEVLIDMGIIKKE